MLVRKGKSESGTWAAEENRGRQAGAARPDEESWQTGKQQRRGYSRIVGTLTWRQEATEVRHAGDPM
jgi:hypothetical protein